MLADDIMRCGRHYQNVYCEFELRVPVVIMRRKKLEEGAFGMF
jgi:hypothetical protein